MRIRLARMEDAAALLEIYAPFTSTPVTFETEPPSVKEFAERIVHYQERHCWLVAEDGEGALVGYAYASPHRARAAYAWACEVSVYLREDSRRQGLGRQLYGKLFELLRRQGYVNAYSGITLPNEASVGLHEALGFRLVGVYEDVGWKSDGWRSVGWWGLRLHEPEVPPAEPKTLREALSPEEYEELR